MAEDRSPKKDLQSSETSGRTGKRRLRIGNVELDNNLVLAPMAGVTDLPFRILCKEQLSLIHILTLPTNREV